MRVGAGYSFRDAEISYITPRGVAKMRFKRDITTIDEILSLDSSILDNILSKMGCDPSPGDFFFIRSQPDQIHFIEKLSPDDRVTLFYGGGKTITIDETLPLFSAGTLIQIMRVHQPVDLRDMKDHWLLIFDDRKVIESEKGELLVSFLWRSIQILVDEDILE